MSQSRSPQTSLSFLQRVDRFVEHFLVILSIFGSNERGDLDKWHRLRVSMPAALGALGLYTSSRLLEGRTNLSGEHAAKVILQSIRRDKAPFKRQQFRRILSDLQRSSNLVEELQGSLPTHTLN